MTTSRDILSLYFLALGTLIAVGCSEPAGGDGGANQQGADLLLGEEPDGGRTVLDVRYALLGEPEEHDHDNADEANDGGEPVEMHDHAHDHGIEGLEHKHEHPVADDNHEGANHDPEDEHDHGDRADASDDDAGDVDHNRDHDDGNDGDHEHAAPAAESIEVVMVGIVGGVANPYSQTRPDFPFVKGEAVVFLADPAFVAEQGTEHQHAPGEECAFCAAHAADAAEAVAMVRFVDESGRPIKTDARELLGVKPGQTVVVTGVAKVLPGEVLGVDARGLYVRE